MEALPEIKFSIIGGKYQAEFIIDQRKTDIYNLVVEALNCI
jgi:hypothetical protein